MDKKRAFGDYNLAVESAKNIPRGGGRGPRDDSRESRGDPRARRGP